MTRRLRTVLAVGLGMALCASPASAAKLPPAVQEVFKDFGRDGVISPCRHTIGDLRETRDNIPPDIDQYAPDFPEAVRAALEAHARGDCAGGGEDPKAGEEAAPAPAGSTGGSAPVAPAPGEPTKTVASDAPAPESTPIAETTSGDGVPQAVPQLERVAAATASGDAPAAVWILALGGALLGLGLLAVLVAGRTRRGAEGLEHMRHSWGEATWRASATWADFADWVRTGR